MKWIRPPGFSRSAIVIDPKKTEEFKNFLKKNAKDKSFWEKNKESISRPVDKAKLDALFEKSQEELEEHLQERLEQAYAEGYTAAEADFWERSKGGGRMGGLMDKLKPCPFCGRSHGLLITSVRHRLDDVFYERWSVYCDASGDKAGCGASCGYHETREAAIKAWNRRADG